MYGIGRDQVFVVREEWKKEIVRESDWRLGLKC